MDPFTASAIATGVGGIASALGSSSANNTSRKMMEQNQAWTEKMSMTAHQREVQDLRAAGLNPMLSGMGGSGAAQPTTANAQVEDSLSKGVSSALETRALAKELESKDANIALTNAQEKTQEAVQASNNASAKASLEQANLAQRASEGKALENVAMTYQMPALKTEGETRNMNAAFDKKMQSYDATMKRVQQGVSTASDAVGVLNPFKFGNRSKGYNESLINPGTGEVTREREVRYK